MASGIRTGDPCGFNKGRSSKFREGSRVRQTPEEGRRTYRPNVVEITINMKTIVRKPLMINYQKHSNGQHHRIKQNFAGAKLVNDKIDIPQWNPNRNTKLDWKIRIESQQPKLR